MNIIRERKKLFLKPGVMLCVVILLAALVRSAGVKAAIEAMTISPDEYNLTVGGVPEDSTGEAYAKLWDANLNVKDFEFQLFDGYDAMISVEDALLSAGENPDILNFVAMTACLYEDDGEGDYYPVEDRCIVTAVCPLPEDMREDAEKVQMIAVNKDGKLFNVSSKLVRVGNTVCAKWDIDPKVNVYAFLQKEEKIVNAEAMPTYATPTPKVTVTPTVTPTAKPKDPTPTVKPTPTTAVKEPTVTPTTKPKNPTVTPTVKPKAPTATPTVKPKGPTVKPTPTVKPVKPTTAPYGTTVKDKTPKTGDDFNRGAYVALLLVGVAVLGGILIWLKKKK